MADSEHQSLNGIDLLSGLDAESIAALERRCSWRNYASHEQIIDRQSDSRDVYFIVRGKVQVVNYSLSGREITFDDLDDGDHFGELAAIDGQPRSANVVALTDTTVASISPKAFSDLVLEHPKLSLVVMQRLVNIVRKSTERIMDLSTLGANNRVHGELLRLSRRNMVDDGHAVISPIPVHSDIASRVSTTRETVARVFSDLTRSGILERKGDALRVLDVDRLTDMVEEVRGE